MGVGGFDAEIILEMANFGRVPVDLSAEVDQRAQLVLFRNIDAPR
jgi:hypothetical protein